MTMLPTSNLSDAQLVEETKRLVRAEQNAAAGIVVHLADMEVRKIHLAEGFPSLYAYCVEELQLTEYEALNRIEVARAGRAYPRIFAMLADGSMTLTAAQLVARKLTTENHGDLLSAVSGRTKKDVLQVLARYFPQPDAASSVRKLPIPRPGEVTSILADRDNAAPTSTVMPAPTVPPTPANHRAVVTPLAPDRFKVTFTADADTCELLDLAKDMLSHAVPNGDAAEVVKRALETLVRDLTRRRFAVTDGHGRATDRRTIRMWRPWSSARCLSEIGDAAGSSA
jgi:hypothetical protein